MESYAEIKRLKSFGIHCIAELYECPPALLNDEAHVKKSLRGAVEHGFASLLHEVSHKFTPQGVTALALIAESHVAIHTWPEYGYVAADAFTCGDQANAEKAIEYLVKAFEAVGFAGAIEVEQQDARTGAHMEKDPEDVHYNFVVWNSNDAGFAIGPCRVDPRSGQILDADVVFNDGWLRYGAEVYRDYLADIPMEGMGGETMDWPGHVAVVVRCMESPGKLNTVVGLFGPP